MDYHKKIIFNPEIMLGKPLIIGTRIKVELFLKKLSEGMDINQLIEAYPNLSKDDI